MQPQLKFARTTVAEPCVICGRKGLTDTPGWFQHPHCQGKPQPCSCGQPSMAFPLCAGCKGTGRIEGDICLLCPPGPCVTCCAKALIGRVRGERDGASARSETVTKCDRIS